MRTRFSLFHAIGIAAALAVPAFADLVPGRIYYSLRHHQGCSASPSRQDLIMEFDPVSGTTREWWRSTPELCGGIGRFAVPPGGGSMRAVRSDDSAVLDIHGETEFESFYQNPSIVPWAVDATYAPNGDYYVSTPDRSVVRFAADGSPAEILAQDWPDDLRAWGYITPAPQGGVFYGETGGSLLQHVGDDGVVTTIADMPLSMGLIRDMATDLNGNLFVLTSNGLLRMRTDTPGVVERVSTFPVANGRLSFDVAANRLVAFDDDYNFDLGGASLFSVDPEDFTRVRIGVIPFLPTGYVGPLGFAVYVPEPGTVGALLLAAMLACWSFRSRIQETTE